MEGFFVFPLSMTIDQLQQEALKQFAALTRHKPAGLRDTFTCVVEGDTLTLGFGRRGHVVALPPGWQDAGSLDDVVGPAAVALLQSA